MVPFISVADLTNYMGEDLTSSDLAVIAIDSACEAIRSFTRRKLNYTQDDVIILDGSGMVELLVPEWPIVDVSEILVAGEEVTDHRVAGSEQSYIVRTDGGSWPRASGNIQVTYSHGYAVSEDDVAPEGPDRVPSDLRSVALAMAAGLMSVAETRYHAVAARDDIGASEPEQGPAPAALTPEQKALLVRYRKIRVA
jgi:hypothetical protein